MPPADRQQLTDDIARHSAWVGPLREEIGRVVVGQEELIERLLVGLLCNGHVLLEGVPGLAKTLTVSALSGCLQTQFSRVQFTPDLLPADLLGTLIYSPDEQEFKPKLGPIFANLILADEINRAPAKVQSALLEAMQEKQVTLGDRTYPLPDPFLVLATQNPIDQEGTYRLPEAQMDRFLLKVKVDYPEREEERQILDLMATSKPVLKTKPVVSIEEILKARGLVDEVYIDPVIRDYIVDLVVATRKPESLAADLENLVRAGSSPRGTIGLAMAARANAFLDGRGFVIPQDVKEVATDVLRHRLLLSYEAEAEGIDAETILSRILSTLPVP